MSNDATGEGAAAAPQPPTPPAADATAPAYAPPAAAPAGPAVPPAYPAPAQSNPYGQPAPAAQPPAYGAPAYPAPAYPAPAYDAYAVPARKTNVMAILSLVFAFVFSVLGVVFGHIALNQIKRTGEDGRGLALAGLIIGYVSVGLGVLVIIAYVLIIVFAIGVAGTSSYYYSS